MAKKVWTTPIESTNKVDWGTGDSTTGNLPLSGGVVQQYIQDNFDSKAGYFYSDETAGKCYVFADKNSYNKWIDAERPEDSELILGTFGIETNFRMDVVVTEDEAIKAAASESTGNTITFTWNVLDTRTQTHTTEDGICTIRFANGTTSKTTTFRIPNSQSTYTMNVDQYLSTGENTIEISVLGVEHKVSGSSQIKYNWVYLSLSSTYDISKTYSRDDSIYFPYTFTSSSKTYIDWWWDGLKLNVKKGKEGINPQYGNQTDTFTIAQLGELTTLPDISSGLHSLCLRAYVISDNEPFYTDVLYYNIIINNIDDELSAPVFPIKTVIPKEYFTESLLKQEPTLYGLSQYVPYDFTLATYYPGDAAYIDTTISIKGMSTEYKQQLSKRLSNEESTNYSVTLQIIPTINGDTTLTISANGAERSFDFTISANDLGLTEIDESEGLTMAFSSEGRTNTSSNRDDWAYKDYTGTFEGLDWTATSGWNDGRLLLNEGSSFQINNFFPLDENISSRGATIELEYSTENVLDDDAILCSTLGTENRGIRLTATRATILTASQGLSVYYKAGENVRIAFVIEANTENDKALLRIYMNGILSGAAPWTKSDSIAKVSQDLVPIKFTGTEGASLSLKQVRCYDRALTSDQIVNNYILYRDTFAEMQTIYERNDIYTDGKIDYEKIARFIPVMLIKGDIPDLDSRTSANKSKMTIMEEVRYIDYIYGKSFVYKDAGMSCQGTSTLTYPKKNYRLYTEEKKYIKDVINPSTYRWVWDGAESENPKKNHSGFFTMSVDDLGNEKNWIEQPWSGKKDGKHKVKYAFRDKGDYENGAPLGVSRWTIKADFPESSSTHNLGVARLWNMAMYNAYDTDSKSFPLRTRVQQCVEDNTTYTNESPKPDIRTTVDGVPIVMFYMQPGDEQNGYTFMGKYNFNNDKANEEIFGFTDIDEFDDAPLPEEYQKTYSYEEENDDGVIELVEKKCTKYKHTMQCWELTNSGNPVALFTPTSEGSTFEETLAKTREDLKGMTIDDMGYEARYPDDAGEDVEDKRWRAFVQPLYEWMLDIRDKCTITRNTDGDIETWENPKTYIEEVNKETGETEGKWVDRFSREKYQWMDVPKMAAYYIYLIRFGAVDQLVKNAMLTSEDGQHFYYILYDNDTIFGLSNLGNLIYGPDITRRTKLLNDFDYAARESTLWNCLEADDEFMNTIVPKIDEMLLTSGISYENVIKTFDTDASDYWCETVHNKDSEYKYIDSYNQGSDYLNSLQGARRTHRRWWVSNRFDFYDGKFCNTNWANCRIKINSPKTPTDKAKFYITAAEHGYYGAFADTKYEGRMELEANEKAEIPIEANVQVGRNYQIVNAHNLVELDLTPCSGSLIVFDAGNAYSDLLGSKMKRLIMGSDTSDVNEVLKPSASDVDTTGQTGYISGISKLKYLEELNIQNYKGITSITDLPTLAYLKKFDARGSGLTVAEFAQGAPVEYIGLPNTMQTLTLSELPLLTTDGIVFDDGGYNNITSLTIDNCEQLLDSWTWVNKFKNLKKIDLEVNWGADTLINWNDLKSFLNGKTGSLRGTIALSKTDLPNDIIEQLYNGELKSWFGEGVLNQDNKLYIKLPKNIYLKLSNYTIIEGMGPYLSDGKVNPDYDEKLGHTYLTAYPIGFDSEPSFRITTDLAYNSAIKIDTNTYEIYANETYFSEDTTVSIYARYTGDYSSIDLKVLNKVYPSTSNTTIDGETSIYPEDYGNKFTVKYDDAVKGKPTSLKWYVNTEEAGSQYVTIDSDTVTTETCVVRLGDNGDDKFESMYNINLYLDITNPSSETSFTLVKPIVISYEKNAIISESSNPELWNALKRGLVSGFSDQIAAGKKAFTKENAEDVTVSSFDPSKLYIAGTSTGEDGETITTYTGVTSFNEFQYFTGLNTSDSISLFANNSVLEEITLPSNWKMIPYGIFSKCTNLKTVKLNAGLENITIDGLAFENCSSLTSVDLGNNISVISGGAFYGCSSLTDITVTDKLTKIGSEAFYNCVLLKYINLTDNITEIGDSAFFACRRLTDVHIPNNSSYTTISNGTFWFCSSITTIELPDNVTTIGENAFASSGLQNVNLNKVTRIEYHAFYGANLQSIYIPETVTYIGQAVFNGNDSLTEITGDSAYNPVKYKDTGLGSAYLICDPVIEQSGDTTYTLMSVVGGVSSFEIPSNIRKIGDYAFYVSNRLASISIPDFVTYIGKNAFYACSSLTSVILPFGTTELLDSCFGYCRQLKTIYVRKSDGTDDNPGYNDLGPIKTLGYGVFYSCETLESLYFRDLESVGDGVFYRCVLLGDITVDNATPPVISAGSIYVFGNPDSKLSSYPSLTGIDVDKTSRYFRIPSGSADAYQATKWYNLWNSAICEFTLIEN